jgi:hypothetical protein
VITQGSGPMYQRGKHSLFFGRVVVRVRMEIEVGVCGFTVDYGTTSGSPSLLYNGYRRSFPRGSRPGRDVDH